MNKITVVIPTIGRSELLSCLFSLEKQSLVPTEILVIDNSQNGQAKKIVDSYLNTGKFKAVRYIREKRIGVSYARNRSLNEATYDTLCYIDDDCVAHRDWIKELNSFYLKNKKAIIRGENKNGNSKNLFSCCEYYDEQVFFKKDFYIDKDKIVSFWLDSKNFIFNKKLIIKNRLSFRDYKMGEDLDFSLQAAVKDIKILYCQKAKITHFGRTGFFQHIKREVLKGVEAKKLSRRWNDRKNKTLANTIFLKQMIWKRWKSEVTLKKELETEIFFQKSFLFRLSFSLLIIINKIVNNIFFRLRISY